MNNTFINAISEKIDYIAGAGTCGLTVAFNYNLRARPALCIPELRIYIYMSIIEQKVWKAWIDKYMPYQNKQLVAKKFKYGLEIWCLDYIIQLL